MSKVKDKKKEMAKKMKSNMAVKEKDFGPDNESIPYNSKNDDKNMGEDRKEKPYRLKKGSENKR